ncbi:uncharacterized protein [Prorops nasuta]|uniref:uncharacterized protein n=1 Tax=Prorops nasuta TaxID=863751 RepID=UPI0034CF233B
MGLLRERGFLSVIYLDDILCVGRSNEVCQSNTEETIALLEFLGFIVNYKKSVLKPSQRCTFLGFIIDSSSMELELPEEKKLSLKKFIKNLISKEECCIRHFAQLIGILVAANQAIKYSWLYIKSLEREKYLELRKNRGNYEANMKLSVQALEDLGWWEANILNSSNSTRRDKFDVTIFTDASTSGWGAVCDKIQLHGFWTMEERNKHINYLELLAIYNALTSLETLLKGKNALLRVDNTTAVAYVNKMGGVRFKDLNMLARKIWKWAECNKVWMFASYIPSLENTGADSLSRIVNIDTEWELSDNYFGKVVDLFGLPEIDLFASYQNKKCKKFCSWYQEAQAWAIDAFTIPWKRVYFYAFPPFSMILRMIMKIINEKAEGIIVIPYWPSQNWYPLYLSIRQEHRIWGPDKNMLLSPSRLEVHPLSNKLKLIVAKVSGNFLGKETLKKMR